MADDRRVVHTRLDPAHADDLAMTARVDEVSVSEAIRRAILAYVAARTADPAFQEDLRASSGVNQQILSRLSRPA